MTLAALVLAFLCLNFSSHAQTITDGSRWFDGSYYYTTSVDGDLIRFTSFDFQGDGPYFNLRKVADEPGAYIFTMKNDAEPLAKLRTEIGCKAQYVRKSGMNFLALYDKEEQLVGTLTLTPDEMESCFTSETWAESQPVDEMLDSFLMNTAYLGKFSKETIQQMINELKAVAGKNPSVIASTNLALMRTELNVPESKRVGNEVREILVRNEMEFLQALGNYRRVILDDGLTINLTKAIESLNTCNEAGILMIGEGTDLEEREGLFSEEIFDGRQLVLKGIRQLTIQGGKDCHIVVEPRYSFVLKFIDCEDLTLDNLTLGHTQGGHCEGGVLRLWECSNVSINHCDMYGCGTYGIEATYSGYLNLSSSVIHDCTYGILQMNYCHHFLFEDCDFLHNREFDLVTTYDGCEEILFQGCRFAGNRGLLFSLRSDIRMENCEIHHDLSEIGSIERISDTKTTWDGKTDTSLSSRPIGPR